MGRTRYYTAERHAYHYDTDLATRPHKIRSTCKHCNQNKDSRNMHRMHGYGSFADTHHTYCMKHDCCAQNDSSCYSAAAKKRKGKGRRKTLTKTRKSKVKYSASCCIKKKRKTKVLGIF